MSSASAARGAISSVLGPDLAKLVQAAVPCSRCGRSASESGPCRVPHPASKRRTVGAMFSGGRTKEKFVCEACGRDFTVVLSDGVEEIQGAQWCFEAGEHVVGSLPANDCRRVDADTFELLADGRLQQRIDALPASTRVLTIGVPVGRHRERDSGLRLNRSLPALEELRLDQVEFREIVLTAELTPRLRKLELLQCLAGECDLVVELPELVEFHTHFYSGPGAPLNRMLEHATKLETFDSYKCWVDDLKFASNALRMVSLERSDSLSHLELWAPNLKNLNVQGCFALDKIIFTKEHPLKALLPAGHRSPRFQVNATNANLGRVARRALDDNPCCAGIDGLDDDDGLGDPNDVIASILQQANLGAAGRDD